MKKLDDYSQTEYHGSLWHDIGESELQMLLDCYNERQRINDQIHKLREKAHEHAKSLEYLDGKGKAEYE